MRADMEAQPPDQSAAPSPPRPPLVGTEWRLTDYLGHAGAFVPVSEDIVATATFADGTVAGSTGCNRYHATYGADGARLAVEAVAMTMMACEPARTAVERAFTAALAAVTTYAIDRDALALADAAGEVLLHFRAVPAPRIDGTRWIATGINNGRGGVVSALEGVVVSAEFGDDGRVTGSGGCNRFSGRYTVDGAALAIGPVAATRKACLAPEGVGEQETSYFAALARVATWSIREERLHLRAEDGALQVEYRAAPGE